MSANGDKLRSNDAIATLRKVSQNGLNVEVDANHFTPLSEDDVLFFKDAIINHYDCEVFLYKKRRAVGISANSSLV